MYVVVVVIVVASTSFTHSSVCSLFFRTSFLLGNLCRKLTLLIGAVELLEVPLRVFTVAIRCASVAFCSVSALATAAFLI